MKFLFDEMLKRLSRWCRIFGIYSEHFEGKSDTELLEYAEANNLVLVTRDVPLFERCKKHGLECIRIESDNFEEQLVQLLKETGAEVRFPDETRCASCNGELSIIERGKAKGNIPEDVYESGKELWQCKECKKIYWRDGSHWKNISKVYENVMKRLSKAI